MKKYIKLIFIFICSFLPSGLTGRDINLDEIYIKKTATDLKKLAIEKLEAYQKAGAIFVDRNIIFAGWVSGDEIIYIKESDSLKANFIFKYRTRDRRAFELCKLHGIITIARVSPNGRYLVIKRLLQSGSIIPRGEMVFVDTISGAIRVRPSSYAFLDFSIAHEGNSVILEKRRGIIELFLDTEFQNELLEKKNYNDIIISSNPTIAYISPDRQRILVLNGSGGNYRAKIFRNGESLPVSGISSSSEVFWLDNFKIVYRTGYAGNYSVMLYNVKNNKTITILKRSFNTNICYSPHAEILSFLKEQVIFLYNSYDAKIINTGIEGEDISFAPNGKFISLLFKKLFLLNLSTIERKRIELKRSWESIFLIYRDLKNKKDEFQNEYSELYIDRKMQIYNELAGM